MTRLEFPTALVVGTLEWLGSGTSEDGPVLATGAVDVPDDVGVSLHVWRIREKKRTGGRWHLVGRLEKVDLGFLNTLPGDVIESLKIGPCDDATFGAVAHLAPGLRRLTLAWSGCPDAVLGTVAGLTGVTELNTYGNGFTDTGVQQLRALQGLEQLCLEEETLSVRAFDFVDQLPRLAMLGLQDVRITPDEIDSLRRRLPGVTVV